MGDALEDPPARSYSEAVPWHDPSVFEPTAREHHRSGQLHLTNITATSILGRYTDGDGRTQAGIYDLRDGDWSLRHGSEVVAPAGSTVVYHDGALHIRNTRTRLID